jgi:osmotically-inducible protein OsmY
MRFGITLFVMLLMSGCTALAVGGAGSSQASKNEREPMMVASDSAITTMITGQFVTDTTVNVFKIGVRTYKGTVTLSGTVGNYVARDQAGYIAKSTKGVVAVNNLIVVDD